MQSVTSWSFDYGAPRRGRIALSALCHYSEPTRETSGAGQLKVKAVEDRPGIRWEQANTLEANIVRSAGLHL